MKLVNIELNKETIKNLYNEVNNAYDDLFAMGTDEQNLAFNSLCMVSKKMYIHNKGVAVDKLARLYNVLSGFLLQNGYSELALQLRLLIDKTEEIEQVEETNDALIINNASYREFINGLIIGISDEFKEYILKKGFVRYVDIIDKIHNRLNGSIPMYVNGELNDKHMEVYSAIYECVITDNSLCFYNGTYTMPNGKNTTFKSLFLGNRKYREVLKKC